MNACALQKSKFNFITYDKDGGDEPREIVLRNWKSKVMAQSVQIKTEKSRWIKASLGLGYTKEGLAPFCDEIAEQQHKDILDSIKQKTGILNKKCPRKHDNCCYLSPVSAESCSIYDIIKGYYTSSNKPNMKNTEPEDWTKDPWSIAKCFIYTSGYKDKKSAADTDITGLLHVIINNTYFHSHVSCNVNGSDIFSKVRDYRNQIFHSSTQELEEQETNNHLEDMIAVLQDGKELIHRQDAQEAVKKLQDLKNEDFIITTEHVKKILEDIREDIKLVRKTTEGLATKDDFEDHKRSVAASLESLLKQDREQIKTDYDLLKADLQERLLMEYRERHLRMPAMPCHPKHQCIFEDVYVNPIITLKTNDKERKDIETKDIFFKHNKLVKSIYILGEAGSGKSSFCKSLISCWCKAHSGTQNLDCPKIDDHTEDLFKVMKKFNFLFFICLRDFTHKESINDMLEKENDHQVLKQLLQRESETCLVVLDGLDEWTSTSVPKRASLSYYTVLTTSRPWKIASLEISENDKQNIIYLDGFDGTSRMKMITNILKILQEQFPDNKKAKDKYISRECEKMLSKQPFYSMTHTAMMLQQLICLWFEDRLKATSRCNLYTCMLELFFVWYKQRDPKSLENMRAKTYGLALPDCLNNTDECESHSYIIGNVSRLAYETLIKNEKETSLTFDSSMFEKLKISDDIKDCCLELGILSEEKGQRLSACISVKSHISFIHKSFQEYLAAVHIVLNINNRRDSAIDTGTADVTENLSQMLNVKTFDELLEQENILIMLCGMDTMVAKSVSKFIYKTVATDDRVVKYRKTINDDISNVFLIAHIQTFTLNCAEEARASGTLHQFSLDLGDLVLQSFHNNPRMIAQIVQNIRFDSVMSFYIDTSINGENDCKTLECMAKCKNLEKVQIKCNFNGKVLQRLNDIIEVNALTLKGLSLKDSIEKVMIGVPTSLSRHIADMTHLVAFELEDVNVTHEDMTSLCTFLSGTGNLQQISINMYCECRQQHNVDLSKHKQLQYLKYDKSVEVTKLLCTNLEVFKCSLNDRNDIQIYDFLRYSMKIKELDLSYRSYSLAMIVLEQQNRTAQHICHTRKLTHVISLSQQLRKLTLSDNTFTDNIITCPSEMKNLESIDICRGTMSLTTWRKFVDSVADLPQRVKVEAWNMCITRDGEECNPDIDSEMGGEKAAALQYVRERQALFDISFESKHSIHFFKKKRSSVT